MMAAIRPGPQEKEMSQKSGRRSFLQRGALALTGASALSSLEVLGAQKNAPKTPATSPVKADDCHCALAIDGTPLDTGTSELRPAIERYSVELRDYERVF